MKIKAIANFVMPNIYLCIVPISRIANHRSAALLYASAVEGYFDWFVGGAPIDTLNHLHSPTAPVTPLLEIPTIASTPDGEFVACCWINSLHMVCDKSR